MGLNEDLLNAVRSEVEDVNRVLELIDEGAEVNATDESGLIPLHLAAFRGHYDMCKMLLENGSGINTLNTHGQSSLTYATAYKHDNVVRLLLEKAADLNMKIVDIGTALHYAIANNINLNLVTLLIEHGADVNHIIKQQNSLHMACALGRKDIVEFLLHNGATIEVKDEKGAKPLNIAKDKGFNQLVEMIEKDYPLWIRLNHAARQGHFDECAALLDQGALVDSSQYGLYCPVAAASNEGHYGIVELLLGKRAWINNKDNNERNPLYLAATKGHKDIVSLLIDRGASSLVKVNGDTLVHVATRNNHGDLARFLILKELNPNIKNNDGYTPLHYAAVNGNEDIAACLIKHGANVNFTTSKMETPLHLACQGGHQQILKILVENGANTYALNDRNEKPMDIVNGKWLVVIKATQISEKILNNMMKLLAPQIAEEAVVIERGSQTVDDFTLDNEDVSSNDSDSDATIDYSLSIIAPIKRLLSGPVLKPNDVKELKSKMSCLTTLILELNDMKLNLASLEEDLALKRHALRNVNRKMERIELLKELKSEDPNSQDVYDEAILHLTRRMDECKRKECQLADEVKTYQTKIRQFRNEASKVNRLLFV